jgi:23S rRNA-/tRNA-specific pseudouridylate synthase
MATAVQEEEQEVLGKHPTTRRSPVVTLTLLAMACTLCPSGAFGLSFASIVRQTKVPTWNRNQSSLLGVQSTKVSFIRQYAQRYRDGYCSRITGTAAQSISSTFQSSKHGHGPVEHENTSKSDQDHSYNTPKPTMDWTGPGKSHATSSFCTHVWIPSERAPCSAIECVQAVLNEKQCADEAVTELSARELLQLGAVWFLAATAPRDPSHGARPLRLTKHPHRHGNDLDNDDLASFMLQEGDYLRIHHHPRRFPVVHQYDWSKRVNDNKPSTSLLPGVVVQSDATQGWIVIDKPPTVPVHMTVDNCQENVSYCIQQALAKQDHAPRGELPYVATTQRLDQNTSGLLVVSTSKLFANYFAGLLRAKTANRLIKQASDEEGETSGDGIHKQYRCLVCIVAPPENPGESSWSVGQAVRQLKSLAETGEVVRHFQEPSLRAPKRFVQQENSKKDIAGAAAPWLECLLRIRSTSQPYSLIGNASSRRLAQALWSSPTEVIPPNCKAIVELQVELLTGRTHQVRGQLSAMGFPLVGDVQYGGAGPRYSEDNGIMEPPSGAHDLALQCYELEFAIPEPVVNYDGTASLRRSTRWYRFRLERAWWSPLLVAYDQHNKMGHSEEATTLASDVGLVEPRTTLLSGGATLSSDAVLLEHRSVSATAKSSRPELLPVRVSLSAGKHKYVLVRATRPGDNDVWWFVKSAPPEECGGPYHGNVAQDLREWIEAAGYKAEVTGGGRIDYRPDEKHAVVYGFSYGFGKGDHAKAASLIREWSKGKIDATFDNANGLY